MGGGGGPRHFTVISCDWGYSLFPFPRSHIQGPKSQVPCPRSQVPDPRSEVPNPKSQVPSPKSQIPNPKSQVPSPKSQVPSPKSQVPVPVPVAWQFCQWRIKFVLFLKNTSYALWDNCFFASSKMFIYDLDLDWTLTLAWQLSDTQESQSVENKFKCLII